MKVAIEGTHITEEHVYVRLERKTCGVMVVAVDSDGKHLANIILIRHDKRLQRPQNLKIFTEPVEDMIESW